MLMTETYFEIFSYRLNLFSFKSIMLIIFCFHFWLKMNIKFIFSRIPANIHFIIFIEIVIVFYSFKDSVFNKLFYFFWIKIKYFLKKFHFEFLLLRIEQGKKHQPI